MFEVPSTALNFSGTHPPASTKPTVSLGIEIEISLIPIRLTKKERTCEASGKLVVGLREYSRTFEERPLQYKYRKSARRRSYDRGKGTLTGHDLTVGTTKKKTSQHELTGE